MNDYHNPYHDDQQQLNGPGNITGDSLGYLGDQMYSPSGDPPSRQGGTFPGFPGAQAPGFPGGPPGGQFPGQGGMFPGFPGGPAPGFPGGGPSGGLPPGQGEAPSTPPPAFIPTQSEFQTFAVDPGAIRGCLFRFTYIWLRRDSFWFYPVFVGRRSVAGWRWTGFRWVYFGIDLNQIESFQCF